MMIDDSVFNSYVDYRTEYKTPQELPAWGVLNVQIEEARLKKEQIEEHNAKMEQVRKGILRMAPQAKPVNFKSGDIGRVIVNPPFVSKLKGIDLWEECPCGSGKPIIQCHVKEVLSKSK